MEEQLTPLQVKHIGGIELNLLNYAKALPHALLEGAMLDSSTAIYDINGEVLFHRIPLCKNDVCVGYADVAARTALGAPLLAVAPSAVWDEQRVIAAAREAAHAYTSNQRSALAYDEIRIVAYSYPKIAIEFLRDGKELLMLEYSTWAVVPPAEPRQRKPLEPSNFERWSLLDELPAGRKRENHEKFEERVEMLATSLKSVGTSVISRALLDPFVSIIKLFDSYELHYSPRASDHYDCYELRGQETSVWCVGASVQMLLDFYRYNYTQIRIAQQLGLGTLANPNGLPYARVGDVVTQLQVMSSNALTAHMLTNPSFGDFSNELRQNRPMISFIPGHSRTVAGYTWSLLGLLGHAGFRGLLVYDPWPPNVGVITRWENFDAQTYQYGYTARVTTI